MYTLILGSRLIKINMLKIFRHTAITIELLKLKGLIMCVDMPCIAFVWLTFVLSVLINPIKSFPLNFHLLYFTTILYSIVVYDQDILASTALGCLG